MTLLFCFSLGMGQINIGRSIFRDTRAEEKSPSSMLRLQHQPGAMTNSNPFLFALPDTQDVAKDSLRIDAGSTRVDTQSAKKSPSLAMLMSAIIPGGGQIYVHRYITIPIIWGLGYYFVKAWSDQNNRYIYYRDLFTASVKVDSLHKGNDQYQKNRDFYRDDRDKFAFYIAITYILNIVDAYVSASLYSFDVSDNLGGSAAIRLRFPIQ